MLMIVGGVDAASAADMRAHGALVQLRQGGDDLGEGEHLLALFAESPRRVEHLLLDRIVVAGQRSRSLRPKDILQVPPSGGAFAAAPGAIARPDRGSAGFPGV